MDDDAVRRELDRRGMATTGTSGEIRSRLKGYRPPRVFSDLVNHSHLFFQGRISFKRYSVIPVLEDLAKTEGLFRGDMDSYALFNILKEKYEREEEEWWARHPCPGSCAIRCT